MKWYEFFPCDTLFFKGAAPMIMGENHSAVSHFPPLPETLSGAVRTMILKNKNISFKDYKEHRDDPEIISLVGKAGAKAPFSIIGPLFKIKDKLFIPAPYSWFRDVSGNNNIFYKAKSLQSRLIKSSSPNPMWVKGNETEIETIGGRWLGIESLKSQENSDLRETEDFYAEEIRSGNALQINRRVREGYLYSFTHIRLKRDVSLIFGINKDIHLDENGIMSLGGEKCFGRYQRIDLNDFSIGGGEHFMSLSMLKTADVQPDDLVATGRIIYRGGWDMAKGFHKPMCGYYPAGTVLNKKINENSIAI